MWKYFIVVNNQAEYANFVCRLIPAYYTYCGFHLKGISLGLCKNNSTPNY